MISPQFQILCTATVALGLVLCPATHSRADADKIKTSTKRNVGGIDRPGGTIRGTIKFAGKKVPRQPIQMQGDKHCISQNVKTPALSERWVFGDNDTLQNVFVWVSKGLEGQKFTAPKTPAILDQVNCIYRPHVSGIVARQDLHIYNSDPSLHNVNVFPQFNGGFNEGMSAKGTKIVKQFNKPEIGIKFRCNVHPWMSAYVHVVSHPFFAVTQKEGTFEIKGLAPGVYTVKVWHEFSIFKPDKQEITVKIQNTETKTVIFTYTPKKRKKSK